MVWARLSMADLARCARTCREFAAHVRELRASKRSIVLPSGMLPRTLGAACKGALLFIARAMSRARTCQDVAAYMQELRLPCAQSCCHHANFALHTEECCISNTCCLLFVSSC